MGAVAHRCDGSVVMLRRRGGGSGDRWCSTNYARETGSSEKEGGPRRPRQKKNRETAVAHWRGQGAAVAGKMREGEGGPFVPVLTGQNGLRWGVSA
jgi:hypothetical protein